MAEFSPGDVVTLKSGGAKMTVLRLEERQGRRFAVCVWFDKNDQLRWKAISSIALQKASPEGHQPAAAPQETASNVAG